MSGSWATRYELRADGVWVSRQGVPDIGEVSDVEVDLVKRRVASLRSDYPGWIITAEPRPVLEGQEHERPAFAQAFADRMRSRQR